MSTCTSCNAKLYLHNSTCVSICPDGYYASNNQCVACVGQCATCSSATLCLSCKSASWLYNTTCPSQCPSGYFSAIGAFNERKCLQCDTTKCLTCVTNATTCLSCNSPLVLSNSACIDISLCPTGSHFINTVNGIQSCDPCSGSCLTCQTSADNCLTCIPGKIFHKGECIDTCPDGTYLISNNSVLSCPDCNSTCKTCKITKDICLSCNSGLTLVITRCSVEVPAVSVIS